MRPIVLTGGDPSGIGPEVVVKALLAHGYGPPHHPEFILVGDSAGFAACWHRCTGSDLPPPESGVRLIDPGPGGVSDLTLPGSPGAARQALSGLRLATDLCLRGEAAAMVTGPVNKEAILRLGQPFVGQTEFLAERCGQPDVTMMLLGQDPEERWLRVSLVTTHLPLRDVPAAVTESAVRRAIRQSRLACRLLRLPRHRVGVCGLNPHAGEGGLLGDEEVRVIAPAIAAENQDGGDPAVGPISADTLFHQALQGAYEVVVAMYHDQGLAPLKTVAFATGVNWTLGLPFVRTSPDHGTAYDLAGRGLADPTSLGAALRLAVQLTSPSDRRSDRRSDAADR